MSLVNINAWKVKTASAKKKIKSSATSYVRKTVKKVFLEALKVSPQWSGDYVFNWRIEVTGYTFGYNNRFKVNPWQSLEDPKYAGHPTAINAAKFGLDQYIEVVKWNSNVRLVNHAPVASLLEAGEVGLRPENLIAGQGVVSYLKSRYSFLKKT